MAGPHLLDSVTWLVRSRSQVQVNETTSGQACDLRGHKLIQILQRGDRGCYIASFFQPPGHQLFQNAIPLLEARKPNYISGASRNAKSLKFGCPSLPLAEAQIHDASISHPYFDGAWSPRCMLLSSHTSAVQLLRYVQNQGCKLHKARRTGLVFFAFQCIL